MKNKTIFNKLFFIILFLLLISVVVCLLYLKYNFKKDKCKEIQNSIILNKEYEISLTIQQYAYSLSDIKNGKIPKPEISIKYLGNNDFVKIWHGGTFGAISVLDSSKNPIINGAITDEMNTSILKKNDPYLEKWNTKSWQENISMLKRGNYWISTYVSFCLDQDSSESIECILELPFVIN